MSDSFDVVVVGAGLSGLTCAIETARRGLTVCVLEAQDQVGAKYCYSGMGAAPVSNTGMDVSRFHGRDARFVSDALGSFDLRAWFAQLEIELHDAEYYGLIQPKDGGPAVVAAMLDALSEAGGELRTESRVTSAAEGFVCTSADGAEVKARALVLATGGGNLPQFGEVSADLPESLGHVPSPAYPALVPVTVAEDWPGTLPGLWMDVELRLMTGKRTLAESTGSMLFTSGALTGEAVFNISHEVEPALARGEELELAVNFHPGMAHEDVAEWLRRVLGERTREPVDRAIDHVLPASLGAALLRRQKVKRGARVMQLNEPQRQGLLREMIDTRLRVTGTLGMRAAEGVTGGVNVREIDPRTFESKRKTGLYVVGRALDVDADWGGFEQHFALASGWVAGRSLLQ